MKTCKVRPSVSQCRMCIDTADFFGQVPNCRKCEDEAEEYELYNVVTSFFGNDYAIVLCNKEAKKVPLDLIYDIKERKM